MLSVEEPSLKARLISEGLEAYLEDNTGAWRLGADGEYKKVYSRGAKRNAQRSLLARLSDLIPEPNGACRANP